MNLLRSFPARRLGAILLGVALWLYTNIACAQKDLVAFVNPLIGTDTDFQFSNGNTYPAITLPWGMNPWSPQTTNLSNEAFFGPNDKVPYWWNNKMKDGWFYTYRQRKIKGFKQTHQPSAWLVDYGCYSIFAETGVVKFTDEERASIFSHKAEIVKPYYYSVYLADYGINVELTPTERAASFQLTFPESSESSIIVDGLTGGSSIKVIASERRIVGIVENNNGGVPENFKNYFVIEIDKDIDAITMWRDSVISDLTEEKGDHVITAVKFKTRAGEVVHLNTASSFISLDQAYINLHREIGDASFEKLKAKARASWNKELNKIEVKGGTEDQKTIFYTAFYRSLLFPRKFYEVDKQDLVVHYSPYNGQIVPGYLFTDIGFWDTFRGVFPFLTLVNPTLDGKIMDGLVNAYNEGGWLPEWASPGYRDCMIGAHSASVIAEAYLKGIRGFDIHTLYEGIMKSANREGPMMSLGRSGVEYYNSLGYVPYDVNIKENVSKTVEYSYDDFCAMKLATVIGRPVSEINTFHHRAKNYEKVFDSSINFMRGKNKDGTFQVPFNAQKWGDGFTEGNAWHYTFSVMHDPRGLINLMGGDEAFTTKLDSLFIEPTHSDFSYYGYKIHEINEMASYHMGQYAHGNEPMHHASYLYNWAGQPWKTQYWTRRIMKQLYSSSPDGLCGDEDNGQTSIWYVLSAMGFYPVCPTTGQWAIGSPLFDEIRINLENGHHFTIHAKGNSDKNIYIQSARFKGRRYSKNYLVHSDIQGGGNLRLKMNSNPNFQRGVNKSDRPFSLSD